MTEENKPAVEDIQKGPSKIEKAERVLNKVWGKIAKNHSPSVFVIGAQKGGTSSIYSYLIQHPEILGGIDKELHFFDRDDRYAKGKKWYETQFSKPPLRSNPKHFIDATPDYMYRADSIKRMAKHYPKAKLIMILREPVSRAYSSWNMYRDFKVTRKNLPQLVQTGYVTDRDNNMMDVLYGPDEFPSFDECVKLELQYIEEKSHFEEPSFIRRGFYIDQIKEVLKYYKRDQLLILGRRELRDDTVGTLNRILTFLKMQPSDWSNLDQTIKNARRYKKTIDPATKESLSQVYAKKNRELFDFLGKELW